MRELLEKSALEVVRLLRLGEISSAQLLDALERRVAETDGEVNALPILCFERARGRAKRAEGDSAGRRGVLAGLPVAVKDLADVAGVRSTRGSPVFANFRPKRSSHVVEAIEAAGGIVYAKSNTAEFGAGGHTFNEVFGPTRNPWNTALSAGGSSGGAAAALASGMAWLAHGSDMAGSLRTPASFCGTVGLRPSPGRVPAGPSENPYDPLGVEGPMARSVADAALFLDAMAVDDPREPLGLGPPGASFLSAALSPIRPARAAFSADLGAIPVDPEVAAICRAAADNLARCGVDVEEAHPDFGGAREAFHTLRAHSFAVEMAEIYSDHCGKLKPEVAWNIKKGLDLRAEDIAAAERTRGRVCANIAEFFQTRDLLMTPAAVLPPFPVDERHPVGCGGRTFETYIDWLEVAYVVTLASPPALAMPCGFTRDGLPVGLQLVGRPRDEAGLLARAAFVERALAVNVGVVDPRRPAA